MEAAAIEAQSLMDANKDRIYECHSRAAEKKSEINSLLSLKDTLTKRKDQVQAESEAGDATGINLSDEYRRIQAERDEAEAALERLEQESLRLKSEYSQAVSREKLLNLELGDRKVAIGQLSARCKMIEEMESAYEGYNEAVKFIMKSGLEGIHGVVADLIRVPSGLELAIETALGASLQNIICRDEKDAQKAIDALKANKVGRLTFLPISGIKPSNTNYPDRLAQEAGFKGFCGLHRI